MRYRIVGMLPALLAGLVLGGLAHPAQAISINSTPQGLTPAAATFNLALDFTDSLPATLSEVNAFRLSVVGSSAALAGRFSFAPAPQWDLIADFGAGNTIDLYWSLTNPNTGLPAGQNSPLGVLRVNLAGLGGQNVEIVYSGGSDINTDQTAAAGPDVQNPLDSLLVRPSLAPETHRFQVPTGPEPGAVPEPEVAVLALLGLAALALLALRRGQPAPCRV